MIWIDDNPMGVDLSAAVSLLSDQRRERMTRFKRETDRKTCAAAYLLLCRALREGMGIGGRPVFGYHEGGKPFLMDVPDVDFNMSHCRAAVVCAVGRRPVGIDVECIREFSVDLARYVLNDGEYAAVMRSGRPDRAFICLWTMKESLLKLTGEGIRRELREVLAVAPFEGSPMPSRSWAECHGGVLSVDIPTGGIIVSDWAGLHFKTVVRAEYVCTLCCSQTDVGAEPSLADVTFVNR